MKGYLILERGDIAQFCLFMVKASDGHKGDVYRSAFGADASPRKVVEEAVNWIQSESCPLSEELDEALRATEYDLDIYTDDEEILKEFSEDCYVQKGSFVNIRVLPSSQDLSAEHASLTDFILGAICEYFKTSSGFDVNFGDGGDA